MELWSCEVAGDLEVDLLNLDHPDVEKRVMAEMESGVEGYYDRRWETAGVLVDWLAKNREVFERKDVLVLGAGIGVECIYLGKFAERVWLNDLAPVALELCVEQLVKNGVENFEVLCGRYEDLALPNVDLVVASFLVYNGETLDAMRAFL